MKLAKLSLPMSIGSNICYWCFLVDLLAAVHGKLDVIKDDRQLLRAQSCGTPGHLRRSNSAIALDMTLYGKPLFLAPFV